MSDQIKSLKQIVKILCSPIKDSNIKEKVLDSLKQINQKKIIELEHSTQENNHKINNNDTSITFQVLKQNNDKKEILGKRKEKPTSSTYNSNEDDKSSRLSNIYYELGVLAFNRRKKNYKYNHIK